jgi:hypothetical protein
VVHRAATPVFETPYAPAIIDMTEGYQILTNVIDTDIARLRVGCTSPSTFAPSATICGCRISGPSHESARIQRWPAHDGIFGVAEDPASRVHRPKGQLRRTRD